MWVENPSLTEPPKKSEQIKDSPEKRADDLVKEWKNFCNYFSTNLLELASLENDNKLSDQEKVEKFILTATSLIWKAKNFFLTLDTGIKEFQGDSRIDPWLTTRFKELYNTALKWVEKLNGKINSPLSLIKLRTKTDDYREGVGSILATLQSMPKSYSFLA
jgi:hypothetical protein